MGSVTGDQILAFFQGLAIVIAAIASAYGAYHAQQAHKIANSAHDALVDVIKERDATIATQAAALPPKASA